MPFTPIHMGPGLLLKSVGRGSFSLMVFGYTQVLIDLESALNMIRGLWPVHDHLHTYLGATLVAAVAAISGRPVCGWLLVVWNRRLSASQAMLAVDPRIGWRASVSGAFLGGWSHVLLDSIMHADMLPLRPLADDNPLLFAISVGHLHQACVVAAGMGVAILAVTVAVKNRGR